MVTVSISTAQILVHKLINDTFDQVNTALYRAKHKSKNWVTIDV